MPSYGIVVVYCPVHVERDQKYDVVSYNRLRSRHHRWPHDITEERPGNAIIRTLSPAGFALASDADDMNTPNSEVGPRIPSCLDPTCSGSVPTRRWRDCDSICFVHIGSGGLDVRFDMGHDVQRWKRGRGKSFYRFWTQPGNGAAYDSNPCALCVAGLSKVLVERHVTTTNTAPVILLFCYFLVFSNTYQLISDGSKPLLLSSNPRLPNPRNTTARRRPELASPPPRRRSRQYPSNGLPRSG